MIGWFFFNEYFNSSTLSRSRVAICRWPFADDSVVLLNLGQVGLSQLGLFTGQLVMLGTMKVWGRIAMVCEINSHHHHIHFRALFSSTEGWAFWQVFLEVVLSTQNDSEGQQNPYLASFCHSQALHPMISLACQIFSVQPHSVCVLLQSSLCCALHVQTISSYRCGAPHLSPGCQALWEGSLSWLRLLPWHCRSNGSWQGHYAGGGSVYPPSWPKSLLHAASHSSHMMSTPYLWSEGADGGWWEGEAIGGTCPMHICSVWSQPPPAESMSPR